MPLERMLVETDVAVPGAGPASRPAEPAGMGAVRRQFVAELRGMAVDDLAAAIAANTPSGVPRGGFVARPS